MTSMDTVEDQTDTQLPIETEVNQQPANEEDASQLSDTATNRDIKDHNPVFNPTNQMEVDEAQSPASLEITNSVEEETSNTCSSSSNEPPGDSVETGQPRGEVEDNLSSLPSTAGGVPHVKVKLARRKRKPSRYQDCMFDVPTKLMNINRIVSPEVFNACHKKTKISKPKSPEQSEASVEFASSKQHSLSKAAVYCTESAGRCVTFDEEGNFRFKVCKEHTVQNKPGGIASYRCDICDMLFPRSFSLRRHYERIHINPRFVRNKGKKDQEIINKLMDVDATHQEHETRKPHEASDKKSNNSSNKKTVSFGKSTVEGQKTSTLSSSDDATYFLYACKLCTKQQPFFKVKSELRRHHQSKHSSVVQKLMDAFKCESCDRSYPTRHELRRHKRTHSGERPYACQYCDKRFPTSTNARRHERTHTGDRPHTCKVCNKGFIQKTDMVKHLRAVHKMKVTKTKAEKAGKKVNALSVKRTSNPQPAEVEDKSNQFEEDIDFAAYLNLDRFEKGSLMGGVSCETETTETRTASIKVSTSQSAKQNDVNDSPNPVISGEIENVGQVSLGVDGRPKRSHKCSECLKSFTSSVNMRRHFRLKHERNQVVRSALPVSMVVTKFKIQEAEGAEVDGNDVRKETKEINSSLHKSENPEEKNDVSVASHRQALPEHSVAQDISAKVVEENEASVDVEEATVDSKCGIATSILPQREPSSKQGSKLGRILERLSSRKEASIQDGLSAVVHLPQNSSNCKPQTKEESHISSNTLLQSMRQSKRKAQLLPYKESMTSAEFSSNLSNDADTSAKLSQSSEFLLKSKRYKLMPTKHIARHGEASSDERSSSNSMKKGLSSVRRFRNDREFHPYTRNITSSFTTHTNMIDPIQSLSASMPRFLQDFDTQPIRPQEQMHNSTTNLPCSVSSERHCRPIYPVDEARSQRLRMHSGDYRPSISNSPAKVQPVIGGAMWNSKMDKPRLSRRRFSSDIHSRIRYEMSPPPRPKPPPPPPPSYMNIHQPPPACDSTFPNIRRVSGSSRENLNFSTSSNDGPLDLRHPSKKPTPEYVITEDGVIDFSKKTRESLSGDSSNSAVNLKLSPGCPSSGLTRSSFSTSNSSRMTSAFHCPDKRNFNGVKDEMYGSTNYTDMPQSQIPLKFHNVEFDKGRQVHGAGTAGRPPVKNPSSTVSWSPRITHRVPKRPSSNSNAFVKYNVNHYYTPEASRRHDRLHGINRSGGYSNEGFVPIPSSYADARSRSIEHNARISHSWLHQPVSSSQSVRSMSSAARHRYYSPSSTRRDHNSLYRGRGLPSSAVRISHATAKQRLPDTSKSNDVHGKKTKPLTSISAIPTSNGPPSATQSSDDIDRDVMMRCIRKAQHELRLGNTTSRRTQYSQSSAGHSVNPAKSSLSSSADAKTLTNTQALLHYPQNMRRDSDVIRVQSSRTTMVSGQPKIEKTSPIPFITPTRSIPEGLKSSPDSNPGIQSRNKLTMTPGFDTNGDDSSREGDSTARSPVSIKSETLVGFDKMERKSSPGFQSSVTDDNKPYMVATPAEMGVEEQDGNVSEEVASNFVNDKTSENTKTVKMFHTSLIHEKVELTSECATTHGLNKPHEDQQVELVTGMELNPATSNALQINVASSACIKDDEFKQTNLSSGENNLNEIKLLQLGKSEENSDEKNVGKTVLPINEATDLTPITSTDFNDINHKASSVQSPTNEEVETPRKFVQKLKLRAVKSQDGAVEKKWTLVEDKRDADDKINQPDIPSTYSSALDNMESHNIPVKDDLSLPGGDVTSSMSKNASDAKSLVAKSITRRRQRDVTQNDDSSNLIRADVSQTTNLNDICDEAKPHLKLLRPLESKAILKALDALPKQGSSAWNCDLSEERTSDDEMSPPVKMGMDFERISTVKFDDAMKNRIAVEIINGNGSKIKSARKSHNGGSEMRDYVTLEDHISADMRDRINGVVEVRRRGLAQRHDFVKPSLRKNVKIFHKSRSVHVFPTILLKTKLEAANEGEQHRTTDDDHVIIESRVEEVESCGPMTGDHVVRNDLQDNSRSNSTITLEIASHDTSLLKKGDEPFNVAVTPNLNGHTYSKRRKLDKPKGKSANKPTIGEVNSGLRKSDRLISQLPDSQRNKIPVKLKSNYTSSHASNNRVRRNTRSSVCVVDNMKYSKMNRNRKQDAASIGKRRLIDAKTRIVPIRSSSVTAVCRPRLQSSKTNNKSAGLRSLARRNEIRIVLPPAEVDAKPENSSSKIAPSPKRRSIRKYSKNFSNSKQK